MITLDYPLPYWQILENGENRVRNRSHLKQGNPAVHLNPLQLC